MGLLDEAIREHLDLKRRRGADPEEVERAEREALGPVRRGPDELDQPAMDALPDQDLPADFAHYAAYKGSIAVNGISLTIVELLAKSFAVCIIPHTKRHTNIDKIEAGDLVNIEFDILAKYVERMLARYAPQDEP